MDGSRESDLRALKTRMEDTTLPLYLRNRAYRKFNDILTQSKDSVLTELRNRLVRAHRANDTDIAAKIEGQIRAYSDKMGYGKA